MPIPFMYTRTRCRSRVFHAGQEADAQHFRINRERVADVHVGRMRVATMTFSIRPPTHRSHTPPNHS